MPVPVIAAVKGVAAGAGANLALCCDFVVAARSASFIQAFSKIGLIPDAGGSWLLVERLGMARAMALAMTGDKLGATQAKEWGLIWDVADDPLAAVDIPAWCHSTGHEVLEVREHGRRVTARVRVSPPRTPPG